MSSKNPIKFVVTGGAGFIGANLAQTLIKENRCNSKQVLVVDHEGAFKERKCTRFLYDSGVKCVEPEVFLEDFLLTPNKFNPETVFHMGASSSTTEMREDFLKRVNVDYSKTLWNFCSQNKIKFIYASSASTYGNGEFGFDDDAKFFDRLKPLNPYGRSKLEFDKWAQLESQNNHNPPTWAGLRFFNVYGPGEDHKTNQASVVNAAFKQIEANGRLKLFKSHKEGFADGEQKRDFVFVGDCVKVAFFFAFGKPNSSGIFNVGTGKAQSFLDLAKACFKVLGKEAQIDFIPTPEHLREHYQYFTEAKLERLRKTGFSDPFLNLNDGAKQTYS